MTTTKDVLDAAQVTIVVDNDDVTQFFTAPQEFLHLGKKYRIYDESEDGPWEIDALEPDGTWRRTTADERTAAPDVGQALHATALRAAGGL